MKRGNLSRPTFQRKSMASENLYILRLEFDRLIACMVCPAKSVHKWLLVSNMTAKAKDPVSVVTALQEMEFWQEVGEAYRKRKEIECASGNQVWCVIKGSLMQGNIACQAVSIISVWG